MTLHPESTWTRPREDCPHPEWWSSTDPQSTEIEVSELVAGFVRALQPELVVETGTCLGQTAWAIGEALRANGHGQLMTIETDPDRAAAARRACFDLPVSVLCMSSLDFIPPSPIGFAWLDSRIELRVAEFELFRPYLGVGAIVGFHDTAPHQGEWGAAVESLPGTRPIRLRTPRGVTFIEVTA